MSCFTEAACTHDQECKVILSHARTRKLHLARPCRLQVVVREMATLHRARLQIHRSKPVIAPIRTNRRVPNRAPACMLDVAVVGAGPAGLCAAAALVRSSANPSAIQVRFMTTCRGKDCVCSILAPGVRTWNTVCQAVRKLVATNVPSKLTLY